MADDTYQRSFGADREPRPAAKASANDPLAELARLIGQSDPFAEFGRKEQPPQQREQSWGAPGEGSGAPPAAPHAPGYEQAGQDRFQDAYAQPGHAGVPQSEPYQGYDSNYYYDDQAPAAGEEAYDDVPPSRRRLGVIAIAAVLALAVVGTAGAFGYRALFGTSSSSPPPVIKADTAPSKVVPPNRSEPAASKQIYDRVGERSAGEKLVSREEQPMERPQQPAISNALSAANTVQQALAVPPAPVAMTGTEPKRVRTIAIKPDQPQGIGEPPVAAAPAPPRASTAMRTPPAAPPRVASAPLSTADAEDAAPPASAPRAAAPRSAPARNAPLSLNPDAPAASAPPPAPTRTASAPARIAPEPSGGGQYAVQVSSQRSEAEAQAAFRALQGKFPGQLGSRSPLIRRADLGDKGVYYRALVGPFVSGAEASELCQSLKSAGGQCIIQKN